MSLNLFDQFASPTLLGVPLFTLSLIFPALLLSYPSTQLINSRLFTAQSWLSANLTKQLFSQVKPSGYKWALLFISLIIYLLFTNLLGLLPHTFTPTTQLSLNMSFAVPFWMATVILGMRNQPSKSLAHLLPEGTPTLLIPVLILIETISLFIRPLALGVRLTANLTAGHLLIQLIASAAFALSSAAPLISIITTSVLLLLTVLEIAVAMIQAFVFVLLLTLYLQENT
uniref:ATP synthase subunit a n=1 Tax=Oreolalax multipunctatus TaxID=445775 RepID=A0A343S952_9ANUR|nr:ATP synthase F0 subunit 6 [Oreolalax multipunctatus]AUN45276.1 ATP synthase F0 subunit 6 [Oreolalax multipunctatus]